MSDKTKTPEEILLKHVNLESSVPQGDKDWVNSDVECILKAMQEYGNYLADASVKAKTEELRNYYEPLLAANLKDNRNLSEENKMWFDSYHELKKEKGASESKLRSVESQLSSAKDSIERKVWELKEHVKLGSNLNILDMEKHFNVDLTNYQKQK